MAGVAGGASGVYAGQQAVLVTVVAQLDQLLGVAAGGAFVPQLLAAARPEPRGALVKRQLHRLFVHPRHHQHIAGVRVLHDARDKARFVVRQLARVHACSFTQ